ncbi:cyclin-like protein [Clavulina sp. PMI_390]|nr:cyclin-like protein [Clavulina sp. PMI_390]
MPEPIAPTDTPASSTTPGDGEAPRVSLYEASTQHQHWRYSRRTLDAERTNLNAAAVEAIRQAFEIEDPGSSSSIEFLTPEEELLLVKLYISKIGQLCAHFRMPEAVEATACTYLRRFYLRNTVMDWHPKSVMLTAIFLASKTTNNPIPIDTYASRIPKTTREDVLDLEFLVAQSLGFEFVVWHPYRALWGIYLDIQTLPDLQNAFNDIHAAYMAAIATVRQARLTDVELLYTPSQIALACWHLAAPGLAEQWARAKFEEAVIPLLGEIKDAIAREGGVPDVERVRDIDKRLKICKNPEKVEGTKAYARKQAAEEAALEEKREKKLADARRNQPKDPFGSELIDMSKAKAKELDEDDY